MKVLTGHLTAGNKKSITAILNAGLQSGKVGNTNYFISEDNGIHTVKVIKNDRGLGFIGNKLRQSTYISTFNI